jgi:hypothetical protein
MDVPRWRELLSLPTAEAATVFNEKRAKASRGRDEARHGDVGERRAVVGRRGEQVTILSISVFSQKVFSQIFICILDVGRYGHNFKALLNI